MPIAVLLTVAAIAVSVSVASRVTKAAHVAAEAEEQARATPSGSPLGLIDKAPAVAYPAAAPLPFGPAVAGAGGVVLNEAALATDRFFASTADGSSADSRLQLLAEVAGEESNGNGHAWGKNGSSYGDPVVGRGSKPWWAGSPGSWQEPDSEPTATATPSPAPAPTATPTTILQPAVTATATNTPPATSTPTPTTQSATATATPSPTAQPATSTPTPTATATNAPAPTPTPTPVAVTGTRDKRKQPFASTSIWNMPIGSGAQYASSGIKDWSSWGVFLEENWIFMDETQPLTPIYFNDDAWNGGSRCNAEGGEMIRVPLPNIVIPGASNGDMPNNASAILMPDGTVFQPQPLTHCSTSSPWTALTAYPQHGGARVSIYGDGIVGAQGGSGMSSLGGVIRLGEFASGRIPHALKLVIDSSNTSGAGGGYRWPAIKADSCAPGCYTGSNPEIRMGSLIALVPSYNCASLRTAPGRIVCQTMKDYGAYVVDSGWEPVYLGGVEYGPNGNVPDEFRQLYGFEMKTSNANSAWALDWRDIIRAAQVITNNGPTSIGGGGTPRVPLAPPIGN